MNYVDTRKVFPVGLQGPYGLACSLTATETTATVHGTYTVPATNLMIEVLPFIEGGTLIATFNKNVITNDSSQPKGNSGNGNAATAASALSAQVIYPLRCPSDDLLPLVTPPVKGQLIGTDYIFGLNTYCGNGGTMIYGFYQNTGWPGAAKVNNKGLFNIVEHGDVGISPRIVTDGLSKTLMYGERAHYDPVFDQIYTTEPIANWSGWAWTFPCNSVGDNLGHTAAPINYMLPATALTSSATAQTAYINNRLASWGSFHPNGANFSFADGSVQFLIDETDLVGVLQPLSTIKGGEIFDMPMGMQ